MADKKESKKKLDSGLLVGGIAILAGGLYFLVSHGIKNAILIGRVVSGEDGSSISGASVTIGEISVTTDSGGNFSIANLPSKEVTITITKTGYITYEGKITLKSGENRQQFVLYKTVTSASLSGVVTDVHTGQAISGVSVTVGSKSATTDSTGHYTVAGLTAGTVLATFYKQWYTMVSRTVTIVAGNNNLNVAMNNLGTITGRVTDSSTGAYLSGVTLTASTGQTATTNAVGQYSITMPSGPASITASKSGYQSQTLSVTPEPDITKPLDFALVQEFTQNGIVQGTVYNTSNSSPISGAALTFVGPDGIAHQTSSGISGTYSIELPGDSSLGGVQYSITVTKSGFYNYTGTQGVRTGAYHTKDIPMEPVPVAPGSIVGTVVDSHGAPISGVRIDLDPGDFFAYTGTDGTYTLNNIPPGNYTIWASKSGYVQQDKSITVYSGQVTSVPNFVLSPSGTGLGFYMEVDFDPSYYPTATLWYADVLGFYNWFKSVNDLWDASGYDLSQYSWPATLTVELYDTNFNLIKRNMKQVTLVNGHVYSFVVDNAGGQLIDIGLF